MVLNTHAETNISTKDLNMGYLFYNIINVIKEMVDAGFKYYNMADSVRAFLDRIMTNSSFLSTLGVLIFIDLVVTILWLVWMTRDSQPGENKWGPNPKEQADSSSIN